MRNRIITVLVALAVGVVLLYGIPRAYLLADLVQDLELRETQRSADLVAVAVAERQRGPDAVTEDFLEQLVRPQESLVYDEAGGPTLRVGAPAPQDTADDLVAVRNLEDGGQVTLRRSGDLVADRVGDALLPLVLIGLALALAAALLARVLADRLSRPFRELADVADAIGRGHFDVPIPTYGVAEAEAIGDAMRRGISRLAELRRRERDIATNASHELRSPISALRMGMEDLASWPQTPPEVAAELTSYLPQLDRLSGAVRTYLETAEQQRLLDVDVVDLAALVRQAVGRWRPRLRVGAGPQLVLADEPAGPLHVCATESTVTEILDHLLQEAAGRRPRSIVVEVDGTQGYGRVRLELEGATTGSTAPVPSRVAEEAAAVGGRLTRGEGQTSLLLRLAGEAAGGEPHDLLRTQAEGPFRTR